MKTVSKRLVDRTTWTFCGFIGSVWVYCVVCQMGHGFNYVHFSTKTRKQHNGENRQLNYAHINDLRGKAGFTIPLGRIEIDVEENIVVRLVGSANRLSAEYR